MYTVCLCNRKGGVGKSTILHSRVDYKNCISEGQGVIEYKPTGKASLEMKSLYKEIFSLLLKGAK